MTQFAENGTSVVILSHLSEQNNTPVTALREIRMALDAAGLSCEIFVAPKDAMEQPIVLRPEEKLCLASG